MLERPTIVHNIQNRIYIINLYCSITLRFFFPPHNCALKDSQHWCCLVHCHSTSNWCFRRTTQRNAISKSVFNFGGLYRKVPISIFVPINVICYSDVFSRYCKNLSGALHSLLEISPYWITGYHRQIWLACFSHPIWDLWIPNTNTWWRFLCIFLHSENNI